MLIRFKIQPASLLSRDGDPKHPPGPQAYWRMDSMNGDKSSVVIKLQFREYHDDQGLVS